MSHATTYETDPSHVPGSVPLPPSVFLTRKKPGCLPGGVVPQTTGRGKGKMSRRNGRAKHSPISSSRPARTPHTPHTLPSTSSGGARAQHQIRPCWYNSVLSSISLPRRCQWPAGRLYRSGKESILPFYVISSSSHPLQHRRRGRCSPSAIVSIAKPLLRA
ncbi:hypothetical protein LZ31DRAFT_102563 [Colletotrichum somersetense]|nr:hypothetical protein LZ31DRAFT_102563 [Colletotrichum somersetense]